MTFINDVRSFERSTVERLVDGYNSLVKRAAQNREYRVTVRELRALTTRELNDLGISRSMIASIAAEAAYGK
jgi:uncharacterized protein YjiS (DUF1127 family)